MRKKIKGKGYPKVVPLTGRDRGAKQGGNRDE